MSEYARIHAVVSGVVQGVGFRYFVLREARHRDLTGWVRNRYDGSVEVTVEGARGMINDFVDRLRVGPMSAHVTGVSVTPEEYGNEFTRFDIRG